jgi:hypothetical protein
MGICGFKYFEDTKKLECYPFNFYILPYAFPELDMDKVYCNSVSTMNFMANSRFDFNKHIYESVGYLSISDYLKMQEKKKIKDLQQ